MDQSEAQNILIKPIGVLHTPFRERYLAPLQAEMESDQYSTIELHEHCNYETALRDIDGFSHIWVIWWFHEAKSWKPVVQTPRDGTKHGLFATRSPHRPNPVAISAVRLHEVKGRFLRISGADMLEGTPVIDLKPYIAQHDSFPDATEGWTNSPTWKMKYSLQWSEQALQQVQFINEHCAYNLYDLVQRRLLLNPFTTSSNRIIQHNDTQFTLGSRAWRIDYELHFAEVRVVSIRSSYTAQNINQADIELDSQDAAAHRLYLQLFA